MSAGLKAYLLSEYYIFCVFSLLRFTDHLSDRLKIFAGQNEKMPVLSGSPALFAKTDFDVNLIKIG